MLKEIKHYECDNVPKDEDILQGMEIAKENNCIVTIQWFVPYSGTYTVSISDGSTLDDVKAKMPKVYGI